MPEVIPSGIIFVHLNGTFWITSHSANYITIFFVKIIFAKRPPLSFVGYFDVSWSRWTASTQPYLIFTCRTWKITSWTWLWSLTLQASYSYARILDRWSHVAVIEGYNWQIILKRNHNKVRVAFELGKHQDVTYLVCDETHITHWNWLHCITIAASILSFMRPFITFIWFSLTASANIFSLITRKVG